jgi:hypothetical protein
MKNNPKVLIYLHNQQPSFSVDLGLLNPQIYNIKFEKKKKKHVP